MSSVRALGIGGLISAALCTLGGFADLPIAIGLGSGVMLAANLYAIYRGPK